MKKYFLIGTVIVLIGFILAMAGIANKAKKYEKLYLRELENVEAYRIANSELNGQARQYKMTIDDLKASNDVLDNKIKETVDKLKISYKKINSLEYQLSVASKTDTIIFSDTIFVNNFQMDTLVGDNWYNLALHLAYPSTIVTTPEFTSEKYVIIHRKKEFDKKPSKCFFIRWFQKKHWVTEVTVEEKNPYIDIKQQKFINIEK